MEFSKRDFSSSFPLSFRRILLLLSFASGCAALIYEVVWFQLLQLVIGSSAISLGVLLGTFMGGMCLGNLFLPRFISEKANALRICAVLETGIGVMGIFILIALPEAEAIYSVLAKENSAGIFLRAALSSACLLIPTILMGATLPILVRYIKATPRGISSLGSFYGCNIAGAVAGCLLAGFYLLRVHDTIVATIFAATINVMIAFVAIGLSFFKTTAIPAKENVFPSDSVLKTAKGKSPLPVYVTIALSGMTALGAEVIWTRLLSLTLGGTVYTFSIILAVFLIGLGVGSHFGTLLARRNRRPELALGLCQLLLVVAIAWTAFMLMKSLPYWPNPTPSQNSWVNFQISFSRCLWALLPATFFWGASFPLALAAAAGNGRDAGRIFGNISAANTLGGIIGGIAFSVVLIPLQGMQYGQRLLIILAAFAAMLMLLPPLWEKRKLSFAFVSRSSTICAALVVLPLFCASTVSKVPGELLAFGRGVQWLGKESELLFAGEGENYPVGVSKLWNSDILVFHVSGKIEASTHVQDMRLQRLLGNLPALLHPQPQSVLVVGCGAGVTAGSFTLHPDVKEIVICELEPLVPKIAAEYFGKENYDVISDYRTQLIFDDARHYIFTTTNKFDIITSDPIHPWVKGSANLYTKEYFELVKAHLNRGGIVTQWVPLYQSDVAVVKSELATFFEVFPNGTIWSSDQPGKGSDIVLLGRCDGGQIDLDEAQLRLKQAGYSKVAASLREIGFNSALDLFAQYSGRAEDLAPWLQDAQINHDKDLRLQYLAGLTLERQIGNPIYRDLLVYRKFPKKLFVGSPQMKQALNSRFHSVLN